MKIAAFGTAGLAILEGQPRERAAASERPMTPDDLRDEPRDGGVAAAVMAGDGTSAGPGTATLGRGAGTQHPDGTPVRVLVVDDEPSLAELLSSVLRYEGWSVQTAGSG